MSQTELFLSPRMTGKRFEGHSIPLEFLEDLAILGELIRETAKACYLKDHPGRKRLPRRFAEGFSLRLVDLDEGSAIAKINLHEEKPLLVQNEEYDYFKMARSQILSAVSAANNGGPISQYLSPRLLSYFDRLGRNLAEDETIDFSANTPGQNTILNTQSRKRLLEASSMNGYVELVELRGSISEVDQKLGTFSLDHGNSRLKIRIPDPFAQVVLDAFRGYPQGGFVLLQGRARVKHNQIQKIESIEQLHILDPNDIPLRLHELSLLKDGWLDGEGKALAKPHLEWLQDRFELYYPPELPLPYLYPTAEGGVQAEWSLGPYELSLEISLENNQAEWHEQDMRQPTGSTKQLDLSQSENWEWLVAQIHGKGRDCAVVAAD